MDIWLSISEKEQCSFEYSPSTAKSPRGFAEAAALFSSTRSWQRPAVAPPNALNAQSLWLSGEVFAPPVQT